MDDAEFRDQVERLPPGMRFVVTHVRALSAGVIVLFGALLAVALVVHTKESGVIAVFCVVAIAMAVANLTVFGVTYRRMTRSVTESED
jgi:uncharacterized protein with PQ loop repeat